MTSHGVSRTQPPRSEEARKRELQKITEYKTLISQLNETLLRDEYSASTLNLTSKILIRNPEYYTVWNQRRRILNQLFAKPSDNEPVADVIASHLRGELEFLLPLLIEYPKTYWIWNHRLWILRQFSTRLGAYVARKAWEQELGLVGKMLARDSRNFHGWSYRRRVIAELEKFDKMIADETPNETEATQNGDIKPSSDAEPVQSLTESEFVYTTKMIHSNLSNFSAWHNRSKLIPKLLNERQASPSDRRAMFDSELQLVQEALLDPHNQSIWFYLEFLMTVLLATGEEAEKPEVFVGFTNHERVEYLEQQIELMKELLEDSDDCKWIYQYLLEYAAKYMEIEGGNKTLTTMEMREWMERLERLDPLRKGRWVYLRKKLGL